MPIGLIHAYGQAAFFRCATCYCGWRWNSVKYFTHLSSKGPTVVSKLKQHLPLILTLFISFVFIQSLFFKFTSSPETQHIFGTLDRWAGDSFGIDGLFAPGGIFSAYVIGSLELVASLCLLAGVFMKKPLLHSLGALIGLGIISGAIFFHLFTPLTTVIANQEMGVENDGGLLFLMACGVWLSCATLLIVNRRALARK